MKPSSSDRSQSSAAVSLRLPGDTKAKLAALARRTRRTQASLANEAITAYIECESAIISGIERGLADAEAGRVTPHDDAMRRLRATIAGAQQTR